MASEERRSFRQYGTPMLIPKPEDQSTARALERVALTKEDGSAGGFDERWIQELIHRYPQIVPIRDIEPGFEQPIPVCMEVPVPTGFVDNLFITVSGDIVLAECKLWRNPQARREVIAQIVDYAGAISRWSFEDLENAIRKGIQLSDTTPVVGLYDYIGADSHLSESEFVDAVSRNLRLGRMLLLIVGDGIREEAENLLQMLQGHAGSHFTLGMVELAVHKLASDGSLIVQPRTLVRTTNIERGIVRISEDRVVVDPIPLSNQTRVTQSAKRNITEEQFFEGLAKIDPALPDRVQEIFDQFADLGVFPDFLTWVNLRWIAPNGERFNLGAINRDGKVRTQLANWRPDSFGHVEIGHRYQRALAEAVKGVVCEVPKQHEWYVAQSGKRELPSIEQLVDASSAWESAIQTYIKDVTEMLANAEA